jgi:hypothetical protein
MRVLFHAAALDEDGMRLQTAVENIVSRDDLEVLHSVEELKTRLKTPFGEKSIGILMASSEEELGGLVALKSLMKDLFLVLVVPDYRRETLELAHRLLPRYLEYKGNNFDDLSLVVSVMRKRF